MKFTKQVKNEIIQEVIDKVICDCCKTEIEIEVATIYEGHGQLKLEFGYGSRFDTHRYEADLCDECAEKMINQFGLRKKE